MNGFGVGASVAIGVEIGARLLSPGLYFGQVLTLMVIYGCLVGFMFHLVQYMLQGARLPFHRR